MPHRILTLLLPFLLFTGYTHAQETAMSVMRNIAYDDTHPRQQLDLFLPIEQEQAAPIIFLIHGGGYMFGSKEIMHDLAHHFAEQGYAVVTPNYRLAPDSQFPAALNDLFCALAWTQTHAADYHLDAERVILMGDSAGANAAALLGVIDTPLDFLQACDYHLTDDPLAVIALYIYIELADCTCSLVRGTMSAYLDVPFTQWDTRTSEALWGRAAVSRWLDNDDPPFYLIHGTADRIVPLHESELLVERYHAVDGIVTYVPLPDADHGFFAQLDRPETQLSLGYIHAWLDEILARQSASQ